MLPIDTKTLPTIDAATNRFNTVDFEYDANGNVIRDAQNKRFTFNGDNKQIEVRDGNNSNQSTNLIGQYFYDSDGKRVKKVVPNGETTVFVYSGGKLVAEYSTVTPTNPTVSYTATDTLGSPRAITDASGNIVSRRDFMPFGEDLIGANVLRDGTIYSADTIRKKFTGYEKDTETGLDFAEARYYNNFHGRFTAVDPLLASGKSANPQTFNRYNYTGNNPLVRTDSSGLDWIYQGLGSTPQWLTGKALQRALKGGDWARVPMTNGRFQYDVIGNKGEYIGTYELRGNGSSEYIKTNPQPVNEPPKEPETDLNPFAEKVILGDGQTAGLNQRAPAAGNLAVGTALTGAAIGTGVGGALYATGATTGSITTLGLTQSNSGLATVNATTINNSIHFSINVLKNEPGVTTQLRVASDGATRILRASNSGFYSRTIALPNAERAIRFQNILLQRGTTGQYNYLTNSCLTHVCGVLRAGGLTRTQTVVEGTRIYFNAQIRRFF